MEACQSEYSLPKNRKEVEKMSLARRSLGLLDKRTPFEINYSVEKVYSTQHMYKRLVNCWFIKMTTEFKFLKSTCI